MKETNPSIESLLVQRQPLRQTFIKIYGSGALLLANTLAIFLLINMVLATAFFIKDSFKPIAPKSNGLFNQDGSPIDNGKRSSYQLRWFDFAAYDAIEPTYAADVLDDFYELSELGFTYQPWVHFSEPPFVGKRVHVILDTRGFPIRQTVNPPNRQGLPVVRIFTLGGSTTFGYNVPDEHTWPSHLSSILNDQARSKRLRIHVEVVNYGRGFYYPSQETALIADLLKNGHRPNVVIFMDGVNTGSPQDLPEFYERFERQFNNVQFGSALSNEADSSIMRRLKWIPMVRLANGIRYRILGVDRNAIENRPDEKKDEYRDVGNVINLFKQNRNLSIAICNLYAVKTFFFLQPNAAYSYPTRLYRLSLPESFTKYRDWIRPFYEQMRHDKGRIYLGDLFQSWGMERKAIVDDVHYSSGFNRFLAEHVAKYIDLESLVPPLLLIDESAATGSVRTITK